MYISDLDVNGLSDYELANLLFSDIKDDKHNGDCIFVAGSSKATKYRLPKALELYKQGRADKILFSGGVKWKGHNYTESINLKRHAISSGVPEHDILIENESLHTLENVLASLLVLEREFKLHQIKRILVVTSAYHMKRLHLTLMTYMPHWIDFTLCPAEDNKTTEGNWFLSEVGRQRVTNEASKLITYVQKGALTDVKVNI